jgi:hypothetical protein
VQASLGGTYDDHIIQSQQAPPSSVPPPISLDTTSPTLPSDATSKGPADTDDETKDIETPTAAAAGASIYGPFIPSRDAVVKQEEEANKAGRNDYVYIPTGPQGVYENGYGSNYHSACTWGVVGYMRLCISSPIAWLLTVFTTIQTPDPYPPDPYLADSQYYPDYGWDHFHEFPFIYVSRKGEYVRL